MRINAIALFFCITIPNLSLGQAVDSTSVNNIESYDKRGYIGLSIGYAIPMGSFSAKNSALASSAFAESGSNFHLFDFGYRITNSFSLKAFYLDAVNSIDNNLLADNLGDDSPFTYKVQTTSYELRSFFTGIGVSKIRNSIDLDLHFLLGYGRSFLPSITLAQTDPQTSTTEIIEFAPSSESGFGVGMNAGLRIHLNSNFDFLTQAAYIIFEKDFEQIRVSNTSTSTTASKISYEILTVNFGFAYRFNFEENN